ncbi:hypothetical protein D3C79_747180 [compost metagenome]
MIEQVTIGEVFDEVAGRVAPVVEDLTAQHMAAHAPKRRPLLLGHPGMPQALGVEILNLEGGVMNEVAVGLEQGNGVMVGPLRATVQTQECCAGAAVVVAVDDQVRRQHLQYLAVPLQQALHVVHTNGHMAQTQDLGRSFAGALNIAEALFVLRRVER